MTLRPIVFAQSGVQPDAFAPAPERILRGNPQQLAWNHYSDGTGQFSAGIWQGEPGAWRVRYDPHEEEFCVLLEGRMTLTADDGAAQTFQAGDAFVVPGGFSGIWENHTRVRKHYAIMALQKNKT
ncbi:cupin domain-containing protein [Thiomonas intermedia]|uniref:cupin domain-containing protein n=1 Tax=Thiomonas intermedia TaxID=926 RepID=UPI0009A54940|nr:cupin domain-containing protein [Thiomonas intermedia]